MWSSISDIFLDIVSELYYPETAPNSYSKYNFSFE